MLTELDSIKAAISDDALFQRALTDFIETAVRITVVGHSLPAATRRAGSLAGAAIGKD